MELYIGGRIKNVDFPEEFCDLPSLKHLRLNIYNLRSLPESFGNLTNLEYIDLSYCSSLERLPISFGNLIKLKYLSLRACKELTLSSGSFGKISTLEDIDLARCDNIETLPSQIAHQPSLEELYLHLSNLKEWPGSIGEPSGLEKLELETPLLEALPASLGRDLRNLKYLKLRGCQELEHLPESILLMDQLIEWTVEDCSLQELNFKAVEGEIETLTDSGGQRTLKNLGRCLLRLQHLKLHNTQISELSFPTGVCPNLQHLDIRDCEDLVEVGPLPNALIKLQLIGCPKLRKIERLSGSAKLQTLDVSRCKEVEELPSMEGKSETESRGQRAFNNLESSFDKCLLHLQHLDLHNTQISEVSFPTGVCPNLQHLDIRYCVDLVEVGTLPNALVKLQLIGCPKLRKIERLCGFANLQTLDISQCKEVEELPSMKGKCETKSRGKRALSFLDYSFEGCRLLLQHLELYNTEISEVSFPRGFCPNLQHLIIQHGNSLVQLVTLPNAFIKLEFYNCSKLRKIEKLCGLAKLQMLSITSCEEMEELSIEALVSLETLHVHQCCKLKNIRGLAELTKLRELNVSNCSDLKDLPGINCLRSLDKLRTRCFKPMGLLDLAQLTQLRELQVSFCYELEELPGVGNLKYLEVLQASGCEKLKSTRGLEQLTQLRELDVSNCWDLEELAGVEYLRSLDRLQACNCVKLRSIEGLAQLTQLGELDVSYCFELEGLPAVEHLKSLKKLRARSCNKLKSIRGSAQLTQLRELDVSGCSALEELPGVGHLKSLEVFQACNCLKLKNIESLVQLTQLRELDVSGCSELEEIGGVEYLLRWQVRASGCVKLKRFQSFRDFGLSPLTRLSPGFQPFRDFGLSPLTRLRPLKVEWLGQGLNLTDNPTELNFL